MDEVLDWEENLALTYCNQGQLKEAEELDVLIMEPRKWVLGKEHPDFLASMNNLVSTYQNQGRWEEAKSSSMSTLHAGQLRSAAA